MKKVFIALIVIIALIAGAVALLFSQLNDIVKAQIESIGSDVLQTTVGVDSVNIELLDGLGEINGFSIANPAGYSQGPAFSFAKVRLDIDPSSVQSQPIVIEEILVDSLQALYEIDQGLGSNLQTLFNNVQKQSSGSGASASESSETSSDEGPDITLVVKKFTVKETQLQLDLNAIDQGKYDEVLPTFAATNVGGTQGLPPKELGIALSETIVKNLLKEVEDKQKEKLKEKAKAKAKEKLEEKLEEKLGDKLDDDVKNQVKGLFDKF